MATGVSARAVLLLLTLASVPANIHSASIQGTVDSQHVGSGVEAGLSSLTSPEDKLAVDLEVSEQKGAGPGLCLNECDAAVSGACYNDAVGDLDENDEGQMEVAANQPELEPTGLITTVEAMHAAERAALLNTELMMPDGKTLGQSWAESNLPTCNLAGVVCDFEDFVGEIVFPEKKLSGRLPDSWSTLNHIFALELDENDITGTLPNGWSTMTNLQLLNIRSNKLTGTLPAGYSTMTNILHMYLDFNRLTGSLPASWSTFASVEWLFLKRNRLTGSLPASWTGMSNVKSLQLMEHGTKEEGNSFAGPLPCGWMNEFPKMMVLSRADDSKSIFRLPFLDRLCAN